MALVTPSHVIVANLGDSRCVLLSEDAVIPLTVDQKPMNVEVALS